MKSRNGTRTRNLGSLFIGERIAFLLLRASRYPRMMYIPQDRRGKNMFQHHVETYGPQSKFGYKDFIPMFKAERFDANEWADLFQQAGAKYVVSGRGAS